MDEAERHEKFEDLCGGATRAFQLLHIWNNTYVSCMPHEDKAMKKRELFLRKAKDANFTDEQIEAFIDL
jgi:hypothetical protein